MTVETTTIQSLSEQFPKLSDLRRALAKAAIGGNLPEQSTWCQALCSVISGQLHIDPNLVVVTLTFATVRITFTVPGCNASVSLLNFEGPCVFTPSSLPESLVECTRFDTNMDTANVLHTICGLIRCDLVTAVEEQLKDATTIVRLAETLHVRLEV